ncbi:hypothetical protein C3F09_08225 [candidate division GN15 bacterium]|uniref:Doubled CXXCH motif domain-containing protein n=1 Tax=candidate division GN15 bacterium TaxID=2072418 RepID=A0A855X4E8_9BACT|nr:MAG: hypothetical protein C3F09_08225 [candidate division GN15 bacterium]
MKKGFFRPISTVGCWVLLLLVFAFAPGRAATPDSGPDDATCLECHDGYDKTLARTVHKLRTTGGAVAGTIACISCHSGGSVHADNPSKDNITNPAMLTGDKALTTCSPCHLPHQSQDDFGFSPHSLQQINCASCHKLHAEAPAVRLLLDDKTEFCGRCHTSAKAWFMRRSNHPVLQGAMTCISCHKFSNRVDENQVYGFARVCEDCHSDVSGPYRYEHPVAEAYDVRGSGCIECHDPHGSENDKLLKQPVANLCQACHFTATHLTAHDGAYANLDCLTCHVDIHGSAVDRRLLDPNIGAKFGSSCWCHGLN